MFNSMSSLPYIPYNILIYLARQDSAEDIWKMLKYNSYDALSKPNLTFNEKQAQTHSSTKKVTTKFSIKQSSI